MSNVIVTELNLDQIDVMIQTAEKGCRVIEIGLKDEEEVLSLMNAYKEEALNNLDFLKKTASIVLLGEYQKASQEIGKLNQIIKDKQAVIAKLSKFLVDKQAEILRYKEIIAKIKAEKNNHKVLPFKKI